MSFQLLPKSVTLNEQNDLEQRNGCYFIKFGSFWRTA